MEGGERTTSQSTGRPPAQASRHCVPSPDYDEIFTIVEAVIARGPIYTPA